jgi:nucleoside-diphosphate-sugar epimerase
LIAARTSLGRQAISPKPEAKYNALRGNLNIMALQDKNYLVTGGTGFIGSALVGALVRAGARVRSLDNDSRGMQRRLGPISAKVELVVGDIRDPEVVRKATAGVDCVCHLAYVNGTEFFYTKPSLVLDVAIRGMMNVLDACRSSGVRDLVLASSSEVYQTPPFIPTDETTPLSIPDILNPRYSYGGGKIACELMAINFGRTDFDRVVIFRPHNVHGPDMGQEHVIPQFAIRMRELCKGTTGTIQFPIQGTGQESRAFIYIDDLVDGVLKVIDRGEHLGIYHIGTDTEVTIEQLARQIAHYFNRDLQIVPGDLALGSTSRRCPDISKMRALGFEPRVSLAEGLTSTLKWYAENGNA